MTNVELRNALVAAGFSVRLSRNQSWPDNLIGYRAAHQDLGIVVEYAVVTEGQQIPELTAAVQAWRKRIRTSRGGYRPYGSGNGAPVLAWLLEPGAPKIVGPRPTVPAVSRPFRREVFAVNSQRDGVVVVHNVLAWVRVEQIVILDYQNRCVTQTGEPYEQCWFLLDCAAHSGGTFNIVTDGDTWMPIDRRTRRLTEDIYPKATVDLSRLNILDRAVARKAIRLFLEKL